MTKKSFIPVLLGLLILTPTLSAQAKWHAPSISTFIPVVQAATNVVTGTTTSSLYVFTTTLSIGMRGTAVTELQKRLTTMGFYSGPVTGYFGSLTQTAVKALQAAFGLEQVGSVGPQTRAVLNGTSTVNSVNQPATTTPTTPAAPPQPAPQPTTSTGLQWGVFVGSGSPTVSSLATTLGKTPDITAIFSPWTDGFPTYMNSVCTSGKTLLIFWENYGTYSLDDIAAGKFDTYLKSWSQGAVSYKCPVIVSLFHEMNGNWDPWDGASGSNTPAKVVAAWKHVHDVVTASNIKWAWAVNNVSVPNTSANAIENYYPGDAYVDYVGVDGFNFGNPWQTFGQVFDTAIGKMQQYKKPIYIFSMGSVAGTNKAAWITEGLGTHIKTYQNIAGWVWFNEDQGAQNWLLSSDAAALAAFKAVLP